MLAVTAEARGQHKRLLPECFKRSQSETNPVNSAATASSPAECSV